MKKLLPLIMLLTLLSGCVDREELKQEIKKELKAELKEEIIAELDRSGNLTTQTVHIDESNNDNAIPKEEKEDWEIDYKSISHSDFTNMEFALPSDPGHYVIMSLEFRHLRKFRRAFGRIMTHQDSIKEGIAEIVSTMTRDDFADPVTRERILPKKILNLTNKYMGTIEISDVVITKLSTK